MNMKKYYEIHVNIPKYGYSIAIVSNHKLSEKEAIKKAISENKFESIKDANFVDYFGELSEKEYNEQFNFKKWNKDMETIRIPKGQSEINESKKIATYILELLGYKPNINLLKMSEKARQFFTWGAHNYAYFATEKNNVGLQFEVKGLKFKGLVRIIYCYATDYFNVEFIKISRINILKDMNRKLGLSPNMLKSYEEQLILVKEIEDLDFTQLHNVLHKFIERDDDPEV